ncbi:MAG: hypothetical protein M3Q79_02545 [bacterium]|nr:hypothetical protein [bacterium]
MEVQKSDEYPVQSSDSVHAMVEQQQEQLIEQAVAPVNSTSEVVKIDLPEGSRLVCALYGYRRR